MIRHKNSEKYVFVDFNGEIKKIELKNILAKFKIDDIIRFQKEDYDLINPNSKYLTHFNLENTDHVIGYKYALVKIIKPGYFDGSKEIKPILDFSNCPFVLCTEAKDHICYEKVTENDFKYSLENIKSAEELKKAILRRYKYSMHHISDKKKLSMGVSITTLKILGQSKLTKNDLV
ncbi:MAG: hypothetical protein ACLFUO_03860 [Candidatus Woesearchaeota archaeon]